MPKKLRPTVDLMAIKCCTLKVNAVTMPVAVRNSKPVGFQVGFSLNNEATTMNSTSHTPYLHSKLFPTMLCQCTFKCIHQQSVAWTRRIHTQIKSHKWKYNIVFNSAYPVTHALRNVLTVCPAKYHGRPSQSDTFHTEVAPYPLYLPGGRLRLHGLKYIVGI
jgi:hypothetical protein